ncbi:hypothetical protein VNO77_22596 [Canavalia gladiata]|uniref:Uncharacterized protein n=1 Tax=Canavalia gladiata TaxID=3824 RepID=A0AAN9QAX9_CANGL
MLTVAIFQSLDYNVIRSWSIVGGVGDKVNLDHSQWDRLRLHSVRKVLPIGIVQSRPISVVHCSLEPSVELRVMGFRLCLKTGTGFGKGKVLRESKPESRGPLVQKVPWCYLQLVSLAKMAKSYLIGMEPNT